MHAKQHQQWFRRHNRLHLVRALTVYVYAVASAHCQFVTRSLFAIRRCRLLFCLCWRVLFTPAAQFSLDVYSHRRAVIAVIIDHDDNDNVMVLDVDDGDNVEHVRHTIKRTKCEIITPEIDTMQLQACTIIFTVGNQIYLTYLVMFNSRKI